MSTRVFHCLIWLFCILSLPVFGQQLLNNPGFEGTYTNRATSWSDISQGPPAPVVVFSRDTVNVHGGLSCQEINLTGLDSANQFIFTQPFTFQRGHIYQGSIWLRSSSADTVNLNFRKASPYYFSPASLTVAVSTSWQQVTVYGGFADSVNVGGNFAVTFQSNGILFLDDASLTDVTDSVLNLPVPDSTLAIPHHYFGIHMNKWSGPTDSIWPALDQGMLRLWDSGLKWSDIETSRGHFNWTKFDKYVDDALRDDSTCSILYTMGISPFWAASNPHSDTVEVTGSPSPPADINDWINYIDSVATRYHGRIKYWEIWNEVSNTGTSAFYTGSIPEMLTLAQAAHQELKAIDSTNIILSPNVTLGGIVWMDQFLFQGGGQYFDNLSFHMYPDLDMEDDIPAVIGVRNLAQNYGIQTVFNTEGAVNTGYPTVLQSAGSVSRAYLEQWAFGISDFNWYCWDISQPAGIALSVNPLDTDRTPAGVAYQQTGAWLQGAVMTSKSVDTSTHTWLIEIQRDSGYRGYIIWRSDWSQAAYAIPAVWNIVTERNLASDSFDISDSTSITITGDPMLLESGPTTTTGLKAISTTLWPLIYPDPVITEATILFTADGMHTVQVEDMTGRMIVDMQYSGNTGTLQRGNLPAGLYIIKISNPDGQCSYSKIEVE